MTGKQRPDPLLAARMDELFTQPPRAAERYMAWASLHDSPSFIGAAAEQQTMVLYEMAVAASEHEGWNESEALSRAVTLLDEALKIAPRDEDMHGRIAIALAETVGRLYQLSGDDKLLRRWIKQAAAWVRIFPEDDWRTPLYVLALGALLYHLAIATGDDEDIRAAVEVLLAARSSVKRSSGIHGTSSVYLTDLRLFSYWRTLDPAELESALHDAWNVVQAGRANPLERYLGLVTLASTLTLRHTLGGADSDIVEAAHYADLALEVARSDSERTRAHEARAIARRHLYRLTREQADIDEAITSWQHLIHFYASDQTEKRAGFLDNYGNSLFDRYELTGDVDDLAGSIEASRAAIAMLPLDSPIRVRALGNLGASLALAYQDLGDISWLDEAIEASRAAAADSQLDLHDAPKLWAQLASALTQRALIGEPDVGLLDEALAAFDRSAALLEKPGAIPVEYALGQQRVWWSLPDRHVAALLQRARLASDEGRQEDDRPTHYLRRALEIGESAKSRLLAEAVARASLLPPPEMPDELVTGEQVLLGELDHVDAIELAAVGTTPTAERLRLLERRQSVRRQLEELWNDMATVSVAGADYVALRRGTAKGLLAALDAGHPDAAYVAVLRTWDLTKGPREGLNRARGVAALALRPGGSEPVLAMTEPGDDPVPDAVRRFVAEVPTDAGLGSHDETWHQRLVSLLRPLVEALGPVARYIVSPPTHGRGLPWHLVLERCGWPANGRPESIVTLPTLALAGASSTGAGNGDQRMRVDTIRDSDSRRAAERGLALILQAASDAPAGPLVVGNPTGDLDGATEEACQVAEVLGVEPLLGADATVTAVQRALEVAPIVHLAAHAQFNPDSPLDSPILLADGSLPARVLVEVGNRAELVVLSACESGVGGSLAGAEIAGLAHALLRVGTRIVIASLWQVDDASTSFLMGTFYRLRSRGVRDASALATAMRETRAQPGWDHPYFWSGFVVTESGDG